MSSDINTDSSLFAREGRGESAQLAANSADNIAIRRHQSQQTLRDLRHPARPAQAVFRPSPAKQGRANTQAILSRVLGTQKHFVRGQERRNRWHHRPQLIGHIHFAASSAARCYPTGGSVQLRVASRHYWNSSAAMLSLSEQENGGERGHVKQSNISASVVCAAFAPVVVKVVNYYLW